MKLRFCPENILYGFTVFFSTLACVLGYWGVETTVSFFQWSFVLLIFWYVLIFRKTLRKTREVRSFVLICAYILIAAILLYAGSDQAPLHAIAFLASLFFLYIIIQREMSKNQIFSFVVFSILGSVFFLLAYINRGTYFGNGWTRTISGFNPQSVGVWAYLFACSCLISLFYFKNWAVRIFLLILIANFIKIEFETDARGSLYAIFFVLLFILFPIRKMILHKYSAFIFAAIPVIFVILFNGIWKLGLFSGRTDGGTLLTGREIIWDRYLTLILDSPFFGDYAQYAEVYSHNIFVDYVIMFGYILAFFWIIFVGYTMSKQAEKIDDSHLNVQYIAYTNFIGALINASVEGMVFGLGAGGALVFAYSFLFLAGTRPKKIIKQKVYKE